MNDMEQYKITLMDGRELDCALKPEQPAEIKKDEFSLDTTGRYLSFNRLPRHVDENDLARAKRQYGHHVFTENAWFFMANAERILSDSRMFLAPVDVQNGLAYTGTGGFMHPTLGVYLEWWLNYPEAGVDANGNLVWYISGSPLSGANCCSSATPDGEQVKIAQRTRFSDIWSSFAKVNNRYTEAKQRCEAYTLEQVLVMLKGDDYRFRLMELKYETICQVLRSDYRKLVDRLDDLRRKLSRQYVVNKRLQLEANRDATLAFAAEYTAKEDELAKVRAEYDRRHADLKRQYHAGTVNSDYRVLLAEASGPYKLLRKELDDMATIFIRKTFGKNPNDISTADILRFAKGRQLTEPRDL